MRDDSDHRKDTELKLDIYNNHIKNKYKVHSIFEDRPRICRMWRDLGLLVFQVGAKDEF